ncbi:MAG: carbohydrate kinase family protein [Flaviflexus sp.]|nr:carbohydrate kinase family protein [Flaviflexus sp.]
MSEPRVYVAGALFLDVVMCGLAHAPRPGEEQWVSGTGVMPGGIANQAVACSRLGLAPSLLTYIGTDRVGRWVREMLEEDEIDLSLARTTERQNITCSLVFDGDRSLTTCGRDDAPLPSGSELIPDVVMASLGYLRTAAEHIRRWRAGGAIVIADTGWDPTGAWDVADLEVLADADVFVPNCAEAEHYTRTLGPDRAAAKLLDYVDTAVVTCGAAGIQLARRGEVVAMPALEVDPVDTTGAGDAFSAGLAAGLARGVDIDLAVELGQAAAGWTVSHIGGSASSPHAEELLEWSRGTRLEESVRAILGAPGR